MILKSRVLLAFSAALLSIGVVWSFGTTEVRAGDQLYYHDTVSQCVDPCPGYFPGLCDCFQLPPIIIQP